MGLDAKSQTAACDETGRFIRVQRNVSMNIAVLFWQRELARCLDKQCWIVKRYKTRSRGRMRIKCEGSSPIGMIEEDDANSMASAVEGDGGMGELQDQKGFEDLEKELDEVANEFDDRLNENMEILNKTLNDNRLIAAGYAFLIMKKKCMTKKVQEEIDKKNEQETAFRMLLDGKVALRMPANENAKIESHNAKHAVNREQAEVQRVKETILMSECICEEQNRQLHAMQTLIAHAEAEIKNRNNILNTLLSKAEKQSKGLQVLGPQNSTWCAIDKMDVNRDNVYNLRTKESETYPCMQEEVDDLNRHCFEFTNEDSCGRDFVFSKYTSMFIPRCPVIRIPVERKSNIVSENAPRALRRSKRKNSFKIGEEVIHKTKAVDV
eukprot:gene18176-19990_t